jgi:hypothetical protein
MTTPIIIAALARQPRRNPRAVQRAPGEGVPVAEPHNYLAQAPKKKRGAPLGNRHAARGGASAEDNKARLKALVRRFSTDVDAAIAMSDRFCAEREMLAALLQEPRP